MKLTIGVIATSLFWYSAALAFEPTEVQKECSRRADERALHGEERKVFRAACKAELGSRGFANEIPAPVPATTSSGPTHVSNDSAPLGYTTERRVALVIGNSLYRHAPGLANPAKDAAAVASKLKALGFQLVIEKENVDIADLTKTLKTFGDVAANADWAVIYYAGHGIQVGGVNYLIPIDAELTDASHVDDEAVPVSRVLSKVETARKMRLVILDACRDDPFAANMRNGRNATRSIGRGLTNDRPGGGVYIAYSAAEGQVAQDGNGSNSPYATALLQHLSEPGIEIDFLFREVRDSVAQMTGDKQQPYTYGSLPAEKFVFYNSGDGKSSFSTPIESPPAISSAPPAIQTSNDCAAEALQKSILGDTPTSFTLHNNTSDSVQIYWLDYAGQRKAYRTLRPGESYLQNTYKTHPWVVTDGSSNCLKLFEADRPSEVFNVR